MDVPLSITCPVVVGRADPLARLQAQAERITSTGAVTFLGAPAGMGKSRMLDEAVRIASEAGFLALAGEARAGGTGPTEPFSGALGRYERLLLPGEVKALFAGRANAARLLLPGRGRRDGSASPPGPGQLAGAVVEVIARIADYRPLLLALDDLQWASSEAVEILEALVAAAPHLPVWLVGTYRPGEVREVAAFGAILEAVERRPVDDHTVLAPLDEDDVDTMLAAMFGHDGFPRSFVTALHERSGGNPFVVEELCRALLAEGVALDDDAADRNVMEVAIPESVVTALQGRLQRLPPDTLDVVQLAAIAGEELDLRVVRAAAGVTETELDHHLGVVLMAGIVEERQDGPVPYYAFGHALVREAILADLPVPVRRRGHRRVAEALGQVEGRVDGPLAGVVADHLVAAGDREAFGPALAAARYAAAHAAPREAARRYAQAQELATAEADRVSVAIEAAEFTFYADRPAAVDLASEAAVTARRAADHLAESRALIVLARSRWIVDGVDAFDPLERALALVAGQGDTHELRALVEAAYHLARTGWRDDAIRGRQLLARATPLLSDVHDPRALARYELARASLAIGPQELLEASDRAVAHLARTGDPFARATGEVVAGHHLTTFHGQLRDGVRRQRRFQETWDELTTKRPSVPFVGHAQGRLWMGDLEGAEALLDQGSWDDSRLSQAHWHEAMSELSFLRDDVASAHEHARRTYDLVAPTGEAFWLMSSLATLGRTVHASEGLAAARRHWDRAVDIAARSSLTCHWLFSVDLGTALAAAREADALADVVERLGAATRAAGDRGHDVAALNLIAGLSAHLVGDDTAAADLLVDAADRYEAMPFPARRVVALLALADVHRTAGRRDDGLAVARQASQVAQLVGAARLVRATEQALGGFGRRGRGGGGHGGVEALTVREREVVRLTVEGLTARAIAERLVVSPRTVEGHLARARAKLGATSKVELVRIALQHQV